ncbi:unnamed protein product [Citrullus colocynthis]|uniref:Uncharacterized protein n=1 Tax=Citrullus colocynthis TaxID=252529 RepID=A0ABP0XRG7_9ROSI
MEPLEEGDEGESTQKKVEEGQKDQGTRIALSFEEMSVPLPYFTGKYHESGQLVEGRMEVVKLAQDPMIAKNMKATQSTAAKAMIKTLISCHSIQ